MGFALLGCGLPADRRNASLDIVMSIFLRIAPWLILGPITGPLVEGVYRNARSSNPVLASMYGVALVGSWVDLAIYGGGALVTLQHWFF